MATGVPVIDGGLTDCEAVVVVVVVVVVEAGEDGSVESPEPPQADSTVASDAIRMRLPLVTLCGDAFASRMAASLLHAAGAPQGISTSLAKYISTVVRLANDPAQELLEAAAQQQQIMQLRLRKWLAQTEAA